jgi:BirA family biotin operon repressor/biotin-[acetyl-CoA-carboxylase] ligase
VFADLERPPLLRGRERRSGRLRVPGGGWTVEVAELAASTHDDLAARARAGAPPGLVLVAEEQRTGRGRRDRVWTSPPRAGLLLSALVEVAPGPWVPLLAGVAVARVLREVAEVPAVLKWPNDVLLDGSKVAGLLAEAVGERAVVVSVGLNVTTRPEELPLGATSLVLAAATVTDRRTLLLAILRGLAGERGPADYRGLCDTLGRTVRVSLPGGASHTGTAEVVDDFGRLVVGGRAFLAGDVVHLR